MNDKLHNLRHSLAHILASAVIEMFPKGQLGVGPVIENGFFYDFLLPRPLTPEDISKLEKRMRELVKQKLAFERNEMSFADATKYFEDSNQPFKLQLIDDIEKYGTTVFDEIEQKDRPPIKTKLLTVTLYKTGKFTDLCRGGHVINTSEIDPQSFKLDKISGAYWRGDQKNPQMQRIYGLSFATKKELDEYLHQREEALKRDHREIGKKLKLFIFDDLVGAGLPLWLPKGTILKDEIEKFAKETEDAAGYKRVSTPHIGKQQLFETSGHLPYYAESMFPPMKLDDGNYYMKAMNCPFAHLIYRSEMHSYKELPLRLGEYGTVYRYELSGTLAGLLRVRMLSMNDAHIYCRADQIADEFTKVIEMIKYYYEIFGIKDYYFRLSLHDPKNKEKYIDEPEMWKFTENELRKIMKKSKVKFVEAVGEAAFYGPKIDVQLKSVTGREETASTNQLDFAAAQRFNLNYIDKDGKEKPVYVIHRAPLGTHERFVAFLIEHFAGNFPTWLAPVQAQILPISEKQNKYAAQVLKELKENGIRAELDDRNESVGRKIREAEMQKIPYMLIVGEKEMKAKSVAIRSKGKDTGAVKLSKFIEKIQKEIKTRSL
jgi:threonyl-tRNA synthetase